MPSARRPRGRRFGSRLTGKSLKKSTDSGLRDVAPGGRFWHGPADLRGRPSGQGRPPFYASAATAVTRGVEQKSEANSMTALWVIVLCGALSIVYAIWATSSVLKSDAGNP